MKSRIITATLCLCVLSLIFTACAADQNNDQGAATTNGAAATASISPGGSPDMNPSPSSSGTASPTKDGQTATTDDVPDVMPSGNVYTGLVTSIDGSSIQLTDEEIVSPGVEPQAKTFTVPDGTAITKSGSGNITIAEIEIGDVLIVTLNGDTPAKIYDYGPLKQ